MDDIKAMLDSWVLLRYNEVRGRTEVHWLSQKLSDRRLGHAFLALGFEYRRTNVSRGYIVVQRSGLEIKERMQRLARDEVTLETEESTRTARTVRVYSQNYNVKRH